MENYTRKLYQGYLEEFQTFAEQGVKLYYPYDRECTPVRLAERMAADRYATYMRDVVRSEEGSVIGVHFNRLKYHRNNDTAN